MDQEANHSTLRSFDHLVQCESLSLTLRESIPVEICSINVAR